MILRLTQVEFVKSNIPILKNIHWEIHEGQHHVVLGKNGCGKSTLVQILSGLFWPTTGKVEILDLEYGTCDIREIRRQVGVVQPVQQESLLQRNLTASEIVITGIYATLGFYKDPKPSEIAKAKDELEKVGLASKINQSFQSLSSGEKARVLLARAMVTNPKLLLLDEPTSHLDIEGKYYFQKALKNLFSKTSIVLITHDFLEISSEFTHILYLKHGSVLQFGKKEDLLNPSWISKVFDVPEELVIKTFRK